MNGSTPGATRRPTASRASASRSPSCCPMRAKPWRCRRCPSAREARRGRRCARRLRAILDARFTARRMLVEHPVEMSQDNGQILRGWIDLLFETDAGWIVIDHKSSPRPRSEWARRGDWVLGPARRLCHCASRIGDGMREVLASPSRRRGAGGSRASSHIWPSLDAPKDRVGGRRYVTEFDHQSIHHPAKSSGRRARSGGDGNWRTHTGRSPAM